MRINNIDKINPKQDMVLTSILTKDYAEGELIIEDKNAEKTSDEAKMYFGEVVSMGPDATNPEHCPELEVKNKVMFSEFAGHHISTKSDKFVKIVRGHDIMVVLEDINNITKDNIKPTADRIIVAAVYRDSTEEGLYLDTEESKDPSLQDLDYGIVLHVGPTCKTGLKVGETVAYNTYVGESIAKQPEKDVAEYRVLNELDVLFTV